MPAAGPGGISLGSDADAAPDKRPKRPPGAKATPQEAHVAQLASGSAGAEPSSAVGATTPTQWTQAGAGMPAGNSARPAPQAAPLPAAPARLAAPVQQPVAAAAPPVRRSPQEDERLVVDLIGVVNRLDKQMRCNIRDALARLSASFAARSAGVAAAEVAPAAAEGGATRQPDAKAEAGTGGSLVVGQPVLGANVWRAVDDSVANLLFHQWSN